nr:thiosulfate oxidation carrier complex protein SoxZ [Halochromatium salexigens]
MTSLWGGGVSKNPYLSFKLNGGEKGMELTAIILFFLQKYYIFSKT